MRLLLAHAKANTLELLRHPAFSVPTLLFPAMFFLFFVATRSELSDQRADLFVASFVGFAVLGVAFFQFGVGIAVDRTSPWETYLRSLPITLRVRFGARIVSALQFGLASAVAVVVTAVLTTSAGLPPGRWLLLGAAALAGSIPFSLMGIALGYWASPRGALPIANVLYLALAFAGGLWTAGGRTSSGADDVAAFLPTRQFAEVLWGATSGDIWRPGAWLALLAWATVFAALARWGYLRDEGERFR
jgi:ABC-2 type transport system permease protein